MVALVDWLEKQDEPRRTRAQESASLYEGKRLSGLHPSSYLESGTYSTDEYDRLYWNVTRRQCRSVQAKIAGSGDPKVQFMVTDGDWAVKRRAYHLDRFVEAQMHLPQGIYENCWALAQQAFLQAAVFGTGAIRIEPDPELGKVAMDLIPCWKIFFDPEEAAGGNPLTVGIKDSWDKDQLAARYESEDDKRAIMEAKPDKESLSRNAGATRMAEQVCVYEAIRLPVGPNDKGKYIRCVDGHVLDFEDYEREKFPIVFLHWARELFGTWATSLAEESELPVNALNETLQRMEESMRLTSKGVLIVDDTVADNQIVGNDDAVIIKLPKGAEYKYVSPSAWGPDTVEWLRMQLEQAFALTGINQDSSASRKQSGVTAGVAIRTLADMETEQFSIIYRQWQQMFIEIAEHVVECTRELAEAMQENGEELFVNWPGKRFLRKIKWEDVGLSKDQYQIQIDDVSGMKNSATDRLQLAQDLYGTGQISDVAFKQALLYLNTKDNLGADSKQRKLVGEWMEDWRDATPEKMESGEIQYRSPIPFMNLEDALLQAAEGYLDGQLDGIPDYNADLFLRFMEECDMKIQERARKVAEIQAQAGQGGAPQVTPAGSGMVQQPAAPAA